MARLKSGIDSVSAEEATSPAFRLIQHILNDVVNNNFLSEAEQLTASINPKPVLLRVGMGSCGLAAGAMKVFNFFQSQLKKQPNLNAMAELAKTGCLGFCSCEVLVSVEKKDGEIMFFKNVNIEKATEILKYIATGDLPASSVFGRYKKDDKKKILTVKPLPIDPYRRRTMKNAGFVNPWSLRDYVLSGGFLGFASATRLIESNQTADIIKMLERSGLKGLGDSCASLISRRWEAFRSLSGPKVVLANCNESDSASIVTRTLLESDPFAVLEAVMIAALFAGASQALIYINPRYALAAEIVESALKQLKKVGLLGGKALNGHQPFKIEIFKNDGGFIAGEPSAIARVLTGKRPKPTETLEKSSLHTLVHNPETLVNVLRVIEHGPEWFKERGTSQNPGTKIVSVSGKIRRSGYAEVEFGTLIRQIIFEFGGGTGKDKILKAIQIGGPLGGFLPATLIDTPLDPESLKKCGLALGLGSLVVLDEDNCLVNQTHYNIELTSKASCGKCIPCREGLFRLYEMLERIIKKDQSGSDSLKRYQILSQLEKLARIIKDTASCGLGRNAVNPLLTGLRYFKNEFQAHIFEARCVAGECKGLLNIKIDAEICRGCGICLERCPENAIIGEYKFSHFIISDKCTNCGVCLQICPFGAIVVLS